MQSLAKSKTIVFGFVTLAAGAFAQEWPQWGQNAQHSGSISVLGQRLWQEAQYLVRAAVVKDAGGCCAPSGTVNTAASTAPLRGDRLDGHIFRPYYNRTAARGLYDTEGRGML